MSEVPVYDTVMFMQCEDWMRRFKEKHGRDPNRHDAWHAAMHLVRASLEEALDASHCPSCNHRNQKVGGPGCSCAAPMPRAELTRDREVAEQMAEALEQFVGINNVMWSKQIADGQKALASWQERIQGR